MSVVVKDNSPLVAFEMGARIGATNRLMLEGIHASSLPVTPMRDTKQLRTAVEKRVIGTNEATITWKAPYASYQERGMRADGSRVVRNYTTPLTHAWFAKEAVEKTMNNIATYLTLGRIM